MKYKKLFSLLSLVCLILLAGANTAHAAGNSLYLSPNSKTVTKGSSFSVAVRVSAGDAANAVQANLSYPADKMDYVSTSYSGSAFEIQAEASAGGGSVKVGRGTLGAFSGDRLVATLTFKAKVDTGSGTISINSDSVLANDGAGLSVGYGGSTIKFSAPAPAAPKPVVPPPDTTAPTIQSVTATKLTTNSAVISWQTDEASDSTVEYGPDAKYGLVVSSGEKLTNHQVTLSSSFLTPYTTFHYRVVSADGSGNKKEDQDRTFMTKGFGVAITVKDVHGKPVSGAQVTVGNKTLATNAQGAASFEVGAGPQTAVIAVRGQTVSTAFTADAKLATDAYMPVAVQLPKPAKGSSVITYLIPVVFLVGIVAGALAWHFTSSPLTTLLSKGVLPWRFRRMKVSQIQRHYGDKVHDRNPYLGRGLLYKVRHLIGKR